MFTSPDVEMFSESVSGNSGEESFLVRTGKRECFRTGKKRTKKARADSTNNRNYVKRNFLFDSNKFIHIDKIDKATNELMKRVQL